MQIRVSGSNGNPEHFQNQSRPSSGLELARSGQYVDSYGYQPYIKPYNPDEVVGKKGIGIYEKMMTDDQVKRVIRFKQSAVLATGWSIQPASDDVEHQRHAAFINWNFDEYLLGSFQKVLFSILDSLIYGFSVNEKIYELIPDGEYAGQLGVKRISDKKVSTFNFDSDEFGNLKPDGLIQFKDTHQETRLETSKFIIWSYQNYGSNHYGLSDLRPAHKPWFLKDLIDRFWSIFLEKYAIPLLVVKLSRSSANSDRRKEWEEILKAVTDRTGIVMNDDEELDAIVSDADRTSDAYELHQQFRDKQIARAILIPDLAVSEGQRVGSMALGKVHQDAFVLIIQNLAVEIAGIVNEQIIKPLIDFNWHTSSYPKFLFNPFSESDREVLMGMFEKAVNVGVIQPQEPFIREELEFPPQDVNSTNDDDDDDDNGNDSNPASFHVTSRNMRFRNKTKLERKVDFNKIRSRLDRIENTAVANLIEVTEAQKRDLQNQFDNGVRPENLTLSNTDDFSRVLNGMLQTAALWGISDASTELKKGGVKLDFVADDLGMIEPADAIAFFEGKIPIPRELLDTYSRQAFTISGIHESHILEQAKRILLKGLAKGTPLQGLMSQLSSLFTGYLQTGEIRDGEIVTPHRLENIVRTNTIEAYNTGRINLYRSPNVRDAVPAVQYSAIIDSRTTPFCRAWDNTVLRLDDPRLDEIVPPNHFQCRSLLVPVTTVEEYEVTKDLPQERPLAGFEY